MKKFFAALLCLYSFIPALFAAQVDTVETYSPSMKKKIKAVVITPQSYKTAKELPTVYLLHGYGGNYSNWITKVPAISKIADEKQLIIVCPDGAIGSWYLDVEGNKDWQYETYVSKELVQWVDKNYKTKARPQGRAITGLSMGGHGALYLAFRHQEVFGAAGSMSGGVDIRPFPNSWELVKSLGTYAQHPDQWEKNTVINLVHLLTPKSLALIIDCGTEDFFFKVNEELHKKLAYFNIPHDYISRPGAHNWDYWKNAVEYQLHFMSNYFNSNKAQ